MNVDASHIGDVSLPFTDGELTQGGLDELPVRAPEFAARGAKFAKWRCVYRITDTLPSQLCIEEHSHTTARYALACQQAGLVPILEPDILMAGTHTIERCAQVIEAILSDLFARLTAYGVFLEGCILKTSMVTPGTSCTVPLANAPQAVAAHTLRVLQHTVPVAVPGVAFLSGGMSEEEATVNLNAVNALEGVKRPWALSFCFGRALQQTCLQQWRGRSEDATAVQAAQAAFVERCRVNALASQGRYSSASA